jgi:ATP-dependent Lon protease
MTDDQPLPELPANKIWTRGSYDFLLAHDLRQMAAFVRETAGSSLALGPDIELWKMSKETLFALAVQAKRAKLNADVIGSLLALALARGSSIALPALFQALSECFDARAERANCISNEFTVRFELKRTIREVQNRLRQRAMLDQFDSLQKEFTAADEALTLAEIWGQFRRSGVDGTTHRVVAPRLKNLRHLDGGAEEFHILTAPLPLWRPSVPAKVLATVLAIEFPHLAAVTGEIATFIAGGPAASMRPILLVGPAGIGKDSIMRRAAELVGRPSGEYDLAGSSDNRTLRGTSKGWSTASPSHAVTVCAQSRCANPLIQYSELDRAGGSRRNGNVHETLLSLCEPSTRLKWYDDGLGTEVDLRDVAFAFTSNSIEDTPQPLLTRLRVIRLQRPGPDHVAAILEQVRRRYAEELKVRIEDLPEIRPEAIERLEAVARMGRFHLRLADRIVRAIGDGRASQLSH